MKQVVRSVLVACLVVSPGAAGAAAQIPGLSAADSKELATYRLTMDTAKKVFGAMRLLTVEMQKDPKVQALMKLEAEIEALQKKEELTEAESERLDKLREQRDAQEEEVDDTVFTSEGMQKANSLDQMEAEIKRQPKAVALMAQAGVSPREYAKFTMAWVMAGMIAGFQKSGMIKDLPKELGASIHPENIKFMEEHGAELERMAKELEALSKGKS
jgi:hypothetical protein